LRGQDDDEVLLDGLVLFAEGFGDLVLDLSFVVTILVNKLDVLIVVSCVG
jgi:hypothetical protein